MNLKFSWRGISTVHALRKTTERLRLSYRFAQSCPTLANEFMFTFFSNRSLLRLVWNLHSFGKILHLALTPGTIIFLCTDWWMKYGKKYHIINEYHWIQLSLILYENSIQPLWNKLKRKKKNRRFTVNLQPTTRAHGRGLDPVLALLQHSVSKS